MKRAIISASQFRLSAPGYDASNAPAANIVFDAFANNAYNGVFLSGVFPASSLTAGGSGSKTYVQGLVNFGKTFSGKPPQAFARVIDPGNSGQTFREYFCSTADVSSIVNVTTMVTQTALQVRCYYLGSGYNHNISFIYVILQI